LDEKCTFYEKEIAELRAKLVEKAAIADQWISQGLQKLQSEAALQSRIKTLESENQSVELFACILCFANCCLVSCKMNLHNKKQQLKGAKLLLSSFPALSVAVRKLLKTM
jgi:hypothetical protein